MTSLEQYINIIQEDASIKGFDKYTEDKEYSKEILEAAKGDYNNLENEIKDVLNNIAGELGFDFDDFDKNKSGDEEGDGDKRAKDDGQVNTQSNSDEGDEGDKGDGNEENKKEEDPDMTDPEKIKVNKQKIALVKMGKNSGELLSKSNADDFTTAIFKKYKLKSKDFLESFIKISMSAATNGDEWIADSVYNNENINELLHFVAFAKGIKEKTNKQQIINMEKYMGNE